mgnify:CR=1 FL=1
MHTSQKLLPRFNSRSRERFEPQSSSDEPSANSRFRGSSSPSQPWSHSKKKWHKGWLYAVVILLVIPNIWIVYQYIKQTKRSPRLPLPPPLPSDTEDVSPQETTKRHQPAQVPNTHQYQPLPGLHDSLDPIDGEGQDALALYVFDETEPKCLDGTPGGYYVRQGEDTRWAIMLEGGGYCVPSMGTSWAQSLVPNPMLVDLRLILTQVFRPC